MPDPSIVPTGLDTSLSPADMIHLAVEILGLAGVLWPMLKMLVKLGEVLKEVKPNGGESLKDRVMKLEKSQHQQIETLADQTKRLVSIERKLDQGKVREDKREQDEGR